MVVSRMMRIMKLQPSSAGVFPVAINRYSRIHVPNEPAASKMTRMQKSAASRHAIPVEMARNRGDVSAYHSAGRCSKESFSFFFFRAIGVFGRSHRVYTIQYYIFFTPSLFVFYRAQFSVFGLPAPIFLALVAVYYETDWTDCLCHYPQPSFDRGILSYTIQSSCSVTQCYVLCTARTTQEIINFLLI